MERQRPRDGQVENTHSDPPDFPSLKQSVLILEFFHQLCDFPRLVVFFVLELQCEGPYRIHKPKNKRILTENELVFSLNGGTTVLQHRL